MAALLVLILLLTGCTLANPAEAPTASPTVTPTMITPDGPNRSPTAQSTAAIAHISPTPTTAAPASQRQATALPPLATPVTVAAAPGAVPPSSTSGTLIHSFTASPTEVNPGETITLAWETSAIWTRICYYSAAGMPWGCWEVPPTGTKEVVIPVDEPNPYAYQLELYPCEGECQPEIARVDVKVRCPLGWFFPNSIGRCPRDSMLAVPAAAQRFEHGMMIWLSSSDDIHVLRLNANGQYSYTVAPNQWQEGMLESDPAIVPPPNLYQPVRGFGMLWRNGSEHTNIRDTMGWATGPEFSFSSAYQCDWLWKGKDCYLQTPDGVMRLFGLAMISGEFYMPTPGP